ncbi:MAG TPA: hypothetical protein VMY39_04130, partial [Planctomycetota bacterium]|nr:hypothetical protein [Planctomycetota bacterium]
VSCVLFINGSFSARWLPNDDSWEHASSAKYIAVHRTYTIDPEARARPVMSYLEPYPPAYPALMAVLHQTNTSIYTTLKLFNNVIIALGLVWFYVMLREWTGQPVKALWMTGVLWVIPCFMSHFIWAQSLALVLFFPAFTALERTRREGAWWVPAALVIAGMFLTQPSAAAIFGLLAALYWLVNAGFAVFGRENRFPWKALVLQASAAVLGLVIAAGYYLPEYAKFGEAQFKWGLMRADPAGEMSLKLSGTSTGKANSLWQFVWAPTLTAINGPKGIGVVLSVVLAAGVVLLVVRWKRLRSTRWRWAALLWLVLTVLGVQGDAMSVSLFPHRFWAFFAIPVAIIAGELLSVLVAKLDRTTTALSAAFGLALGLTLVFGTVAERLYASFGDAFEQLAPGQTLAMRGLRLGLFIPSLLASVGALALALTRLSGKGASPGTFARFALAAVLVAGVIVTSGYPKARFEGLIPWGYAGVHFYPDPAHRNGFIEIRAKFPPDTRIFGLDAMDDHIIGFDMFTPPYDLELKRFRDALKEKPLDAIGPDDVAAVHRKALEYHFGYVMLTPFWATRTLHSHRSQSGNLTALIAACGVSRERVFAFYVHRRTMQAYLRNWYRASPAQIRGLVDRNLFPSTDERKALADVEKCLDRLERLEHTVNDMLARHTRLRQLIYDRPELFRPVMYRQSEPFGVTLFEVRKPSTATGR